MALTDAQKRDTLKELFDATRITVKCGKHLYFGPVKERPEVTPMLGCADCWRVFYISEMATTPPDERRQKLEELEEVMHNMVAMVERGTWDFEPYEHAQIEFGVE
jgi:hypothetical protein